MAVKGHPLIRLKLEGAGFRSSPFVFFQCLLTACPLAEVAEKDELRFHKGTVGAASLPE
jgi:hypothetical protein